VETMVVMLMRLVGQLQLKFEPAVAAALTLQVNQAVILGQHVLLAAATFACCFLAQCSVHTAQKP